MAAIKPPVHPIARMARSYEGIAPPVEAAHGRDQATRAPHRAHGALLRRHRPTRRSSPWPRIPDSPSYQCTPRIRDANAICSLLGCASPFSAALSPLAAAESGNSSNAVFITTS